MKHSRRDGLFVALSHRHRRTVLSHLWNNGGTATLTELAVEIERRERPIAGEPTDSDAVRSAHISLYHRHVPLLEDANLIEYDDRSGDVVAVDLSDDRREALTDVFDLFDGQAEAA